MNKETTPQSTALSELEQTFGMTPRSLEQAMNLAKILAESDFVPKDFKNKVGNCLVAIQLGCELGLAPMQALQSVAVINGRPVVWGDAMLGLCKRTTVFEGIREEYDAKTETCICTVKRKNEAPITRTFSKADAIQAKLWNKPGPWSEYPRRMLQCRSRSWALRDCFPDILKGLYSREEAEDGLIEKGIIERVDENQQQDVRLALKSKSEEAKQKALENFKANKLQQTIEAIDQVSTLAALNKSAILIDDIPDDKDRQVAQNHWNVKQAELKKLETKNQKPES